MGFWRDFWWIWSIGKMEDVFTKEAEMSVDQKRPTGKRGRKLDQEIARRRAGARTILHYTDGDEERCREIQEESVAGMEKHGGTDPVAHDLAHTLGDWVHFIRGHAERSLCAPPMDSRQHMVKVAALALSAIRAMDNGGARNPE